MDHAVVPSGTRTQRLQNVDVRESDIRGGQEYIQRKEFYDELKVKRRFLSRVHVIDCSIVSVKPNSGAHCKGGKRSQAEPSGHH